MPHPLVTQLHFTRGEFVRCLAGVTEADATCRVPPMNCLSWIVGHLASQEDAFWNAWARGKPLRPDLIGLVGYGSPASTPPLAEMWSAWRQITAETDTYLDTLTSEIMLTRFPGENPPIDETIGTLLQRNIYHYWYHIGEAAGIRQALGHTGLPAFVGDLGGQAPYRPG